MITHNYALSLYEIFAEFGILVSASLNPLVKSQWQVAYYPLKVTLSYIRQHFCPVEKYIAHNGVV